MVIIIPEKAPVVFHRRFLAIFRGSGAPTRYRTGRAGKHLPQNSAAFLLQGIQNALDIGIRLPQTAKQSAGTLFFKMLGGNEFRLRQGSAVQNACTQ